MTAALSKGAIGRAAVWSILNQSVGQILVLLGFLITARFVPKDAFGIMAVCIVVVEAFRQIWAESVGTSIAAKKDLTDRDYNAGFLIIAAGGLVSAIIVFLLAGPIARLMHHADIVGTLHWMSLLLLTGALSRTHEAWLVKHLQFKVLALRSLGSIFIGGGVGILMAVNGYGLLSLIAQQLVVAVVGTACLWLATAWRPSFDTGWENITSLLRYSRHVSLSAVASFANAQSDVFFSSYYLGPAMTGVYTAAKRILIAISIMFSLNSVALPALAAVSKDSEGASRSFLKAVSLTTFLTAPLYAGLAVLSPDLIHILMGDKWADVAPVVSILAVNGYVSSLLQYSSNIMLVKNKPRWQTFITIVNALANVTLFMIVGRLGLIALALAYVAKNVVLAPLWIGAALYLLKMKPVAYLRQIAPPIIAALAMGIAVRLAQDYLFPPSSFLSLIVMVPGGAVIYFLTMLVIDRTAVREVVSMACHTVRKSDVSSLSAALG
jgi:O-antigen/teichoic acid export membrane protein